jgi:hypothetical protein
VETALEEAWRGAAPVILCELCRKQKAVFRITLARILNTVSGEQSQHVPYGQTKQFGICETCLPFEIVRETTETVTVVKKKIARKDL